MEKFLNALSVILEEDVKPEQNLRDFITWDSFAFLSTIALGQKEYGKNITRSELQSQNTIMDVYTLLTGN